MAAIRTDAGAGIDNGCLKDRLAPGWTLWQCWGVDYKIEFDADGPPDLAITLSGVGDPAAVARVNEEFASDPRFQSGLLMLVDLSEFENRPMTETQADATVTRILERDWNHPAAAIAFIVADEQAANEMILWRARLGGSKSRRQIFTSREHAVTWLATQRSTS